MKYPGSKARIAKHILSLMELKPNQVFVDLFHGGCNILDKVSNPRIANEYNFYIHRLFQSLVYENWIPPKIVTQEEYYAIKADPDKYEPQLVGFVAVCCSFGGKWWGGYARGKNAKGEPRNYALESHSHLLKQRDKLVGVQFYNLDYSDVLVPLGSLVYCDPPYKNAIKYKDEFDHERFWDYCRSLSKISKVFISEYDAPEDFKCIWEKEVNAYTSKKSYKKATEKLFVYNGNW